jgi:hypothetical protein
MKKFTLGSIAILAVLAFAGIAAVTQNTNTGSTIIKPVDMKTYIIEREIPGAGKLTAEQLKGISQTSCGVLKDMGPGIEWIQSYVTGNKIYCVYRALNEELIKEHAKRGGFPANAISEVATVISPATATN